MKNPFTKKKPLTINANSLPTGCTPIGISGVSGISGPIGVQGSVMISGSVNITTSVSSAFTWTPFTPEQALEERKKQLTDEFERNPELFSDIIVELRRRKIKKIKENVR